MAEYVVEKEFNNSYHRNYFVHEADEPSNRWVAKILRPHQVNFPDFHARAALAYRLANQLGLRTLESKTVHLRSFRDFAWPDDRVDDWAFLTRFAGENLPSYLSHGALESIANLDQLPHFVAFHLWVGNLDKKATDYLVDDGTIISIDYQLAGPGYSLTRELSLGAWAEEYDIHNPDDVGWALEGREDNGTGALAAWMRATKPPFEVFEPLVNRIEQTTEEQLLSVLQGLAFFSWQNLRIDGFYYEFLRARRGWLRESLKRWIKLDYPVGARPQTRQG